VINLQIDANGVDRMAQEIGATEEQLRKALNSTVRKINVTMRREAVRQMSQETGLPQKRFMRRIRSFKLGRTAGGWKVFIGLDSLNLMELGAKETATGVTSRKGAVKSAFMAVGKSGIASVFKRTGRGRLPIKQIRHDIEPIGTDILAAAERIFDARFFKVLEAELKWRTQTLK
jgi:hypothetical protein